MSSHAMPTALAGAGGNLAFLLIYLTFFLDNVLLTVLVPLIPDWVRGGAALSLWAQSAPLAHLLNHSLPLTDVSGDNGTHSHHYTPHGAGTQAVVGLVLGAKAAAQLVWAAPSARAVALFGPAPVLRAATLALAAAALAFWWCAGVRGWRAALLVAGGRALHGAGAAMAAVAGLALVANVLPPKQAQRALGPLLGAVALGVLVGYPFGGAAGALSSLGAPFLILAAALILDFALQCVCLDKEEYNRPCASRWQPSGTGAGVARAWSWCGGGAARASAGAVLVTTTVMATLEPCLPIWITDKFHPQRWAAGTVFIPDSLGYLIAASTLGAASAKVGAERVALAGVCSVAAAALWLPTATSVAALAAPHALLGAGLGACDAALFPAVLSRARRRRCAAGAAALLSAAGAAAYALGPALGGLAAAALGFDTTMRTLAVLNLLYAAYLYRALAENPLSQQWGYAGGDSSESESDDESTASPTAQELTPLQVTSQSQRVTSSSHHSLPAASRSQYNALP